MRHPDDNNGFPDRMTGDLGASFDKLKSYIKQEESLMNEVNGIVSKDIEESKKVLTNSLNRQTNDLILPLYRGRRYSEKEGKFWFRGKLFNSLSEIEEEIDRFLEESD